MEPLPHAYPFRFAERTLERTGQASGRVRAGVTAGSWAGTPLAPALLAELIAQAALLLEGGDVELGKRGFLAGVSDLSVERIPEAGDQLEISVSLAGAFGPAVRFDGRIVDDSGRAVASGSVTVRR